MRALNEKLNLGIEIIGCPTIRTSEGLALSSRNSLLSSKQIENAKVINQTLKYINTKVSDWGIREMRLYFKKKVENYTT